MIRTFRFRCCAVALALALACSSIARARDDPQVYAPVPPSKETSEQMVEPITLTLIGLALTIGGLALAGYALVPQNTVHVEDLTLQLNDTHFHVGDTRTLTAVAKVSHGHVGGADSTGLYFRAWGAGLRTCASTDRPASDLPGQNVKQKYTWEIPVQGVSDGNEPVYVKVIVFGEDFSWLTDQFSSAETITSISPAVLQPFSAPYVVPPDPVTFLHPGPVVHALKLTNHSEQEGFAHFANIHATSTRNVFLAAGTDFGPGMETTLAASEVAHEAGPHPGTTVEVPFTYHIDYAPIEAGYPWYIQYFPYLHQASDYCHDPHGEGGPHDVEEEDTNEEQRRQSSGTRPVGARQRSRSCDDEPLDLSGVVVALLDQKAGVSYPLECDADGEISWSNLTLGPTVDVVINLDGDPRFDTKYLYDVPLSRFEPDFVGDPDIAAIDLIEAEAPLITGTIATNDGTPMWSSVHSRREGCSDEFIAFLPEGPFTIDGYGMLTFDGADSAIVIKPRPAFNCTLASSEPVVIPVDMTQGMVDLGLIEFDMLPPWEGVDVGFTGVCIDGTTNVPIEGLSIVVHDCEDTTTVLASTTTAEDGSFFMDVATGIACASMANAAALGYPDAESVHEINFGANGLDTLDIGIRHFPSVAPIPTTSSWGLAVLALSLMVAMKLYFGRRRAVQAA